MTDAETICQLLLGEASNRVCRTNLSDLIVGETMGRVALAVFVSKTTPMRVFRIPRIGDGLEICWPVAVLDAIQVIDDVTIRDVTVEVLPHKAVSESADANPANHGPHHQVTRLQAFLSAAFRPVAKLTPDSSAVVYSPTSIAHERD